MSGALETKRNMKPPVSKECRRVKHLGINFEKLPLVLLRETSLASKDPEANEAPYKFDS